MNRRSLLAAFGLAPALALPAIAAEPSTDWMAAFTNAIRETMEKVDWDTAITLKIDEEKGRILMDDPLATVPAEFKKEAIDTMEAAAFYSFSTAQHLLRMSQDGKQDPKWRAECYQESWRHCQRGEKLARLLKPYGRGPWRNDKIVDAEGRKTINFFRKSAGLAPI